MWTKVTLTVAFCLAFINCDQGASISPNVYLIDDATSSLAQVADNQIIFPASNGQSLLSRIPGDILVSGYGPGFLRTVNSVSVLDDKIVVNTRQAALADAIERGDGQLSFQSSWEAENGNTTGTPDVGLRIRDFKAPSLDIDLTHTLFKDTSIGASLEITKGSAKFEPQIDFDFHIDGHGLRQLNAVAEGQLDVELDVKATGHIKQSFETELWKSKAVYKTILVGGWFPVVVEFRLLIVGGFEAGLDHGVFETGGTVSLDAKAGVHYEDGAWHTIAEKNIVVAVMKPSVEAVGETLTVYAYPKLTTKLYAVAGPYLYFGPFIDVTSSLNGPDSEKINVSVSLKGTVGGEVEVFDRVLAKLEATLFDYEVWSHQYDLGICTGRSSQPCGKCGTQKRTCNGGQWSPWGSCVEGSCMNTPCTGKSNGAYCASTLTGYPGAGSDLVTCSGGALAGTASCANGCQVNQPASNDNCKSMPCTTYYVDSDGDRHGDRAQPGMCLTSPSGSYTALNNDDCNDSDPDVYSGHTEWFDVKDNDCNGQVDEVGLNRLDRWHKEWNADDWEHRFATSSPGSGFTGESHWIKLYPTDVCTSSYAAPGCSLVSGGAYAQVRSGIQLAALGECSGQYTISPFRHVTLYLLEDSKEYRDYTTTAGFTCRRIGYVLYGSSVGAFGSSVAFSRLRSCFCAGGRADNMWSSLMSESGHTGYAVGYPEDTNHFYAPGGY